MKMSQKEIEEKIKDLKMELIKNRIASIKGGKLKIREIKRTIARLITIQRLKQRESLKKEIPKKSRKK